MSPLWRICFWPLIRSSAVWLALQPFFVGFAWMTPRFLEAELIVLGVLLGFGAQAALPRERAEYLWQLPFWRHEIRRFLPRAGLAVLLITCLCTDLEYVLRPASYVLLWFSSFFASNVEPGSWHPELHLDGTLWLNLYGLPALGYWSTAALLSRRRKQSSAMLGHVSWVVLVGVAFVFSYVFLTPRMDAADATYRQNIVWRNALGALAAVVAWVLSRSVLARADRIGIDGYPLESLSWES